MFEESPDAFMARFKPFAATVELFSHGEGSPLIECRAAETIFQVFERTGPYLSQPGPAQLIINPTTDALTAGEPGRKRIEVSGLARLKAEGMVLQREPPFVIVDAGLPLIVGVVGGVADDLAAGDWVAFESEAPVHAFVLPPRRRGAAGHSEDDAV